MRLHVDQNHIGWPLLHHGSYRSTARLGASYQPTQQRQSGVKHPTQILRFSHGMSCQLNQRCSGAKQLSKIHRGGDTTQQAPAILHPWIYLYHAVPKMIVPFTNLDVSFTIFSAIILTCLDFAMAEFLYKQGWPKGDAPNAKQTRAVAGSLTTIFHSTSLVACLGACLFSYQFPPSAKMSDAPQWWQDSAHALIQFCTGYMIYDAGIQFIADKWVKGVGPVLSRADWMFLGHHAATSLYMTSARILEAGHVSAMILMAGGEFTAPFQNAFRISRITTKMDMAGSLGQVLHPYIRYIWAVLYAFFRIVVGPACAIHLTQDLIFSKQGREHVPLGLSIVWLAMCWTVLLGSIPWIYDALGIIRQGIPEKD